jgi:hypothetical protein
MKFTLKSLVSVAAFAAASMASATPSAGNWSLVSGSGVLTIPEHVLSVTSSIIVPVRTLPNIAGLDVTPGAANTAASTFDELLFQTTVALTFSAATITGDTLTSLRAANSFVNIKRTWFDEKDQAYSRSIYLANIDVDLDHSTVYADLYSRDNTAGVLTSFGKQAIFTATEPGGVAGGTGGTIVVDAATGGGVDGHASGDFNGPLRLTASTATTFLSGLGLDTSDTDPVAILLRTSEWGSLSVSGVFRGEVLVDGNAPVPEPSTYLLFGAGLAGLGLMRRRRHTEA